MRLARYILLLFIVGVAIAEDEGYIPIPTVYPADHFDAEEDVKILKNAIDASNKTAIINVLTRRVFDQRLKIAKAYNAIHEVDLIGELKDALTGNLKDLIVALMTPWPDCYAKMVHEAIPVISNNPWLIMEILSTLSNDEILMMKKAYEKDGASLEKDLKDNINPELEHSYLVSLFQGKRNEDPEIDYELAASDARKLYDADANEPGTDETRNQIASILVNRSFRNLRQMFRDYRNISNGTEFLQLIAKEFHYDDNVSQELYFFATEVGRAFETWGLRLVQNTNEGSENVDFALINIIATRSEIDLGNIKEVFKKYYDSSIEEWIKNWASDDDDYKYALLSLVSTDEPRVEKN